MWVHPFLQNHQNHNSLLNNHRLKKNNNNSGIYQKRYPTSKDQKEATTRCSWKSVPREDRFNTTGLLARTVVLKDTGSNIKSIKKEANDRRRFSLALNDLRCPCNHSAAASVRSQHPHAELGRDWRSSLHAQTEKNYSQLTKESLQSWEDIKLVELDVGSADVHSNGRKWEHPGARGGLGDKVTNS